MIHQFGQGLIFLGASVIALGVGTLCRTLMQRHTLPDLQQIDLDWRERRGL